MTFGSLEIRDTSCLKCLEHLQQPHLRTWETRVVAHKTNGYTVGIQLMEWDQTDDPSIRRFQY